MAILDYSRQLNTAGPNSNLSRTLSTAGQLQGLRNNEQQMQIQRDEVAAQEAGAIKNAAAQEEYKIKIQEGADLLKGGTPDQVQEFMVNNPNVAKQMISAAKFKDEGAISSRIKYAQGILRGDDALAATAKRIQEVEASGGDASSLRKSLEAGDVEAIKRTAGLDLAMLDKDYKNPTGKDKSMTDYQAAMVKGGDADRAVRKEEAANKRAEIELKKMPESFRKEKLQADLDAKIHKLEAEKAKVVEKAKVKSEAAQAVVDSGDSTLSLINEIENHPGFGGAVGMKDASHAYGIMDEPFAGSEESGVVALIETLEAQNFLTAIGEFKSAGGAGALSDNEGKKLGAALSSLNRAQGEGDFKKSLNIVRNLVKKQVSRAKKQVNNKLSRTEASAEVKEESAEVNQNEQALQWAEANPNDPRAALIMQKINGGG